jgi:hypothetical protein
MVTDRATRPIAPDREIVAIRTAGPHEHIIRVKLSDGQEQRAGQVIAAILAHEAHYTMRLPQHELPLLVRVQTCPDCNEDVLWA